MRKIILPIFLIVLLTLSTALGEEQPKDETNKWPLNRIGLTGSTFTGYGLTYYRHFGEKLVGKICFFAFGTADESGGNSNDMRIITGGELQYNLHRTKYSRLHIFAAFSYWHDENKYDAWSREENYSYYQIERNYVSGIGFGFEFLAWKIISFNIETGILYRYGINTETNSPDISNNSVSYPKSFGFGIGGGITYAF